MHIKQSNRVGIEAVRATSRGQRKPRNSLSPEQQRKRRHLQLAAATGALGSHCELAKHVDFTPQLAGTKSQSRGEVEMLKATAQESVAGAARQRDSGHTAAHGGESAADSRNPEGAARLPLEPALKPSDLNILSRSAA